MTRYEGPNRESGNYKARFVRVEDTLVTSEPNATILHSDLALEEGILEQLVNVGRVKPEEIDGGFYSVEGSTIYVLHFATDLEIPIILQARERTVKLFKERSIGYDTVMEPGIPYHFFELTSRFNPHNQF